MEQRTYEWTDKIMVEWTKKQIGKGTPKRTNKLKNQQKNEQINKQTSWGSDVPSSESLAKLAGLQPFVSILKFKL